MSEALDLAQIHNPYDFANPVSERNLFSGRERELNDIKYYLDQAKNAPRPINIALLGSRAAGKTSLLNMIALEAKDRGMCVARVNLNEGDTQSEISFFFKLFDGVFSAVCDFKILDAAENSSYCFGGKHSKTYETYLDMISAYEIPEDKTWCPFIFPIQYAKAMSSGRGNGKISDQNFINDLINIHKEIAHPIIILFDECNVLANHRILLEMVRNTFMNTSGYMLVFTGTQDLFPVMDEVFSPIVRQFKKVEVVSFEHTNETKQCISKPLESIGVTELGDVFETTTLNELSQIHDLTGGRPYEIQLLCHFMFKRVQVGRTKKMELDLDVLDDVLNELRRGHDISSRPIISKIRELNKRQLAALSLLTSSGGHANFDQIWFIEYVLNGEVAWSKRDILELLSLFSKDGILAIEDGIIRFAGDDFDRIYIKYFARQRKFNLAFPDRSPERSFNLSLGRQCQKIGKLKPFNDLHNLDIIFNLGLRDRSKHGTLISPDTEATELFDVFKVLEGMQEVSNEYDVYKLYPDLSEGIYWLMFENELVQCNSRKIVNIHAQSSWMSMNFPFYSDVNYDEGNFEQFIKEAQLIKERALELGGSLEVDAHEVDSIPLRILVDNINLSSNAELRKAIADNHYISLVRSYLADPKDMQTARFHAEVAVLFNVEVPYIDANNFGYLQIAFGNLVGARESLNNAIRKAEKEEEAALPYYNLGIIDLQEGNIINASSNFKKSIELCETNHLEINKDVILFIPSLVEDKMDFIEKRNLDLLETAREALNVVQQLEKAST
jgi:hypothetical protein